MYNVKNNIKSQMKLKKIDIFLMFKYSRFKTDYKLKYIIHLTHLV